MRHLILEQLAQQGVDYQLAGDEVRLPCPQCILEKSRKFKLYFNLSSSKLVGQCWICESKYSLGRLIYDFKLDKTKFKFKSVSHVSSKFKGMMSLREAIAKKALSVKLPSCEAIPRIKKAFDYMKSRDVTREILKLFKIRVCLDEFDLFYNRIIIPILNRDGKCCSYVGRDFTGTLKPKYLFRSGVNVFDFIFGEFLIKDRTVAVIFEGTFSVLRTYHPFQDAFDKKVVPLATFSHHLSRNQERVLRESGICAVLIFYDGDSEDISKNLCKRLSKWASTDYVKLPFAEQPDDFSPDELVGKVREGLKNIRRTKIERISYNLKNLKEI